MLNPKKILIVDDHPLFREGLKSIINSAPCYRLTGEAGTATEGMQMTRILKPDLILIDISLPDKNGIELTREIMHTVPQAAILIISIHADIQHIVESFRAGAKGYITKESTHDRLLQGLETIAAGEYYIDSAVSGEVVKTLQGVIVREARLNTDQGYGRLTMREQQVMRLLAEGLKNKEIGELLCISPKTVENHRTHIMHKLNLQSTIELVRYAAKIGLIDVNLWKT